MWVNGKTTYVRAQFRVIGDQRREPCFQTGEQRSMVFGADAGQNEGVAKYDQVRRDNLRATEARELHQPLQIIPLVCAMGRLPQNEAERRIMGLGMVVPFADLVFQHLFGNGRRGLRKQSYDAFDSPSP